MENIFEQNPQKNNNQEKKDLLLEHVKELKIPDRKKYKENELLKHVGELRGRTPDKKELEINIEENK